MGSHVRNKLFLHIKTFRACLADKPVQPSVNRLMMSKTFLGIVDFRTIFALIFQTFVLSYVFFEIFVNIETPPAYLAIIRELSCMYLYMLFQAII